MVPAESIRNFLYPKSVLLVGASSKPKSIGYEILKSMISFGYKGKIFVINPKADEILGIKCNKSIEEINEPISLAIILVPRDLVFESIQACNQINIKNIIIITAGFKEVGEEGAILEEKIKLFAKENNIRLIGPNCMGLINADEEVRINATFAAEVPHYSPISFLSQSGALAAAVLNTIRETGYTFGDFVSIGNKADVNEIDLLEFWWKDSKTEIVTMYLESFEDGRKFFELASRVTREKPVIVLKSARTKTGSVAASSHTGALATQDDIVDAALKQSGCIRVEQIDELFETAKAFLKFPVLKGKKIAVLTNAGGPAILCVDEIEKNGLEIAAFSDETINKLKSILHPQAITKNPVDMLPGADAITYRKAVDILATDENVDAIISIFVEPVMIASFEVIKTLSICQRGIKKPLLIVTFPLPHFWERWKREGLQDAFILKSLELAPRIIKNIYYYSIARTKSDVKFITLSTEEKNRINKSLDSSLNQSQEGTFLKSKDCFKILSTLNLPVIRSRYFRDIKELRKFVSTIKYPCVLKISSQKLTHKTDVDGVVLNIPDKKSLIDSYKKLESQLKRKNLLKFVEEFEIQPFIPNEIELIIGGYRDKFFGPVILFGAGGKLVEIIKDKNLRLAPVSKDEAIELIRESKTYDLLKGYRNIKPANINKIADIISKLSTLLIEFSEINEIDLNPVIIHNSKPVIVDSRIKIENNFLIE